MKTLQELYEEVKASDELKKALADAVKADKVTEFLKANGCDSTVEELKEFVAEKVNRDKPLREFSGDELEKVAGGKTYGTRECPGNSHDCSDCGVCI